MLGDYDVDSHLSNGSCGLKLVLKLLGASQRKVGDDKVPQLTSQGDLLLGQCSECLYCECWQRNWECLLTLRGHQITRS